MSEPPLAPPDAVELDGLLADDGRRRVVAALVLGAATIDDVCRTTGLDVRGAATALVRLESSGLVLGDGDYYHLIEAAFGHAARAAAATRPPAPGPGRAVEAHAEVISDEHAHVLRTFVVEGRLRDIPTQRSKRLVVLNMLAQEFEPGLRYEERVVNERLATWHPDTAALRRYLVDEGFLSRDHGVYWRSGGTLT
ncbi:MAG: DUF2087 domain-containing protein [Actinomycetota bacterium]|nr:DUF2087 domain-containing protein [Actinomycetota bacterium]